MTWVYRLFDELIYKALKMTTSNLQENSGTVEYFAGQYNFRCTGRQGKWLKHLSLSPALASPKLINILKYLKIEATANSVPSATVETLLTSLKMHFFIMRHFSQQYVF